MVKGCLSALKRATSLAILSFVQTEKNMALEIGLVGNSRLG
jgi:hypothetical protein